jgi:transmembrane protein 132
VPLQSLPEITEAPGKKHHHHHHNRPPRNGNIQNRRSCGNDIQIHNAPAQENQNASQRNLSFTQQQIHAALFNVSSSSVPQYTVQPINNEMLNRRSIKSPSSPSTSLTCNTHNEYELHMAERLVENAVQQQKTAFKFDTITPKKSNETDDNSTPNAMHSTPIQENSTEVKLRQKDVNAQNKTQTMESSSDDNGGFVTPPGEHRSDSQVKRATVVGNPMFSSSPDSDLGPNETLGLDDLDMDYEQIMHYFDNLKVYFFYKN